jgi:hypothetical protein
MRFSVQKSVAISPTPTPILRPSISDGFPCHSDLDRCIGHKKRDRSPFTHSDQHDPDLDS